MNCRLATFILMICIPGIAQHAPSDADRPVRHSTDFNWSETNRDWPLLQSGIQETVTLSPCPKGVDTAAEPLLGGIDGSYPVYIADGSRSESVYVKGGTCRPEATQGTIIFTPYFSHASGAYTLGSASAGIQEAINDNCGTFPVPSKNGYCHIVIPPTRPGAEQIRGYDVYDTIYFHAHESVLNGYGAVLNCHTRGPCLQIGNLLNSNHASGNTVEGLSFRTSADRTSDPAYHGSLIKSTKRTSGTVTIETILPHGLRTRDRVTIMFTDMAQYWGDVPSITVTSPTTFSYARTGAHDIPIREGPGLVALTYVAILDNGTSTHFLDIQNELVDKYGSFNHFFDFWDDENATVDHFNNNGIMLNSNPNWMGYAIYSGGAQNLPDVRQQLAPVISVNHSTFTNMNCFDVTNSNGLYVRDTVCQNSIVEAHVSNLAGNYQGAYFENIYSESAANANGPKASPWGGLGVSGLLGGPTSAGAYIYHGQGGFSGSMAGVGATPMFVWYVIAHDDATHTVTSPMPIYHSDLKTGEIEIRWPRIANGSHTVTYDLLRAYYPRGLGNAAGDSIAPNTTICTGGANVTCGSIASELEQCAGFVCSYTDNVDKPTSSYSIRNGTFVAAPDFWPGQAVLSSNPVFAETDFSAVGIAMYGMPSIYANNCSYGLNTNGGYSACFGSKMATNNAAPNQTALLLTDGPNTGGGGVVGAKGRLNFITNGTGVSAPHHIITLLDSNPRKTTTTTGYRPAADNEDVWIGLDSGTQVAFGSPTAISNYINNTGDNLHWLERLTATQKAFAVPIALQETDVAPKVVNGSAVLYADSSNHKLRASYGKGPFYPLAQTIGSGSIPLHRSTIAPGDCSPVVSVRAPDVSGTDVVSWTLSGITTKSDGLLKYSPTLTDGYIHVSVCNPTTSGQIASELTLNWRVIR